MREDHGATPGCKACEEGAGQHSSTCRARLDRLYGLAMPTEEPPGAPTEEDTAPSAPRREGSKFTQDPGDDPEEMVKLVQPLPDHHSR
eukprot:2541833-Amphidinium_carterae.2